MDKASDVMNRILEDYPEIWKDERLFKAVISDLLPEEVLLRNLLIFCISQKIPDELNDANAVDKIDLHRYVSRLMRNYGCTESLATRAVILWADAIAVNHEEIEDHVVVMGLSEIDALKEKIAAERNQLISIIAEKDELQNSECPRIEAKYMQIFGYLELEIYEAQCKYKRLKRHIQLVRAKLNRQEKPNKEDIKIVLDKEFAEYAEKIKNEKERLEAVKNHAAENSKGNPFFDVIKKLYRGLVKRLHPDINPSQTKEERELFNKVVEAYRNNDLQQLELINEIAGKEKIELYEESVEVLKAETERLQRLIDKITAEIESIKESFPYCEKEFLDDADAVLLEKERLQKNLDEYNEQIAVLMAKIKAMEE